jgi:hypothetical protein
MRAAMALARCERDVARDVLQAAVKIEDQVVLVGVMRALGMVGGPEALQAIDDVIRKLDARARNQAEFARTLIAHRLGRADAHGPYAPAGNLLEPAADSGRRLHIRPARPSAVERLLTSTGSSLYGIEVDDEAVLEYSCDRASGAILLNRALTRRNAISELRARPAILGLEARRDLASGEYSVSAVILTAPSGDAVDIAVHLTNGTLLFTGRAELRDREARWTLSAIRRNGGFPFRASGTFVEGQLNIERAESGARVVQRLRPKPIDVGALNGRPANRFRHVDGEC